MFCGVEKKYKQMKKKYIRPEFQCHPVKFSILNLSSSAINEVPIYHKKYYDTDADDEFVQL